MGTVVGGTSVGVVEPPGDSVGGGVPRSGRVGYTVFVSDGVGLAVGVGVVVASVGVGIGVCAGVAVGVGVGVEEDVGVGLVAGVTLGVGGSVIPLM